MKEWGGDGILLEVNITVGEKWVWMHQNALYSDLSDWFRNTMLTALLDKPHCRVHADEVTRRNVDRICSLITAPQCLKSARTTSTHITVNSRYKKLNCFLCFDTISWASGRASGLYKLSDEVLVWLSFCSKVQIVCIWSSWCHCHPKTPASLASFKSRLVITFLVSAYQGCPGKEAVKRV